MARNRVIYQSEALFVSEDVTTIKASGHEQLDRIQSANYSFSIPRQDINEFGSLSKIDSVTLESPTVALDFSYYLTNGFNERAMGFTPSGFDGSTNTASPGVKGFLSGFMGYNSGRNYYILTSKEGDDAASNKAGSYSLIGVGNAFVTDYSVDASIGSIPTVSVSLEGSNINAQTNISGNGAIAGTGYSGIHSVAVKSVGTGAMYDYSSNGDDLVGLPIVTSDGGVFGTDTNARIQLAGSTASVSSLRPGDVTLDFGGFTAGNDGPMADVQSTASSIHLQSASLALSMSRTPLERLGQVGPFARALDFPINVSLSCNAILNEITALNLRDLLDDQTFNDVTLTFKDPNGNEKMVYTIIGAQLDSESFSSSVGANKTVDLTFTAQIGGPGDENRNLIVESSTIHIPFGKNNGVIRMSDDGGLASGETLSITKILNGNGVLAEAQLSDGEQNRSMITSVDMGKPIIIEVTYEGDGGSTDDLKLSAADATIIGPNATTSAGVSAQKVAINQSGTGKGQVIEIRPTNRDHAEIDIVVEISA